MATEFRKSLMPAWILLPVSAAATIATLVTWGTGSLLLGVVTALFAAWRLW